MDDLKNHVAASMRHLTPDTVPSVVTFSGAASTVAFWGLNVPDICAIVSCCIAIGGLVVQIWVARNRIQAMREAEIDRLTHQAVSDALKDPLSD